MSDGCEFCGADDCVLPKASIAWGMYGIDYAFCESCLEGMTAYEFWRQLFLAQDYAWPPLLQPEPPPRPEYPLRPIRSRQRKRPATERERGKMSNALRYKVMRRDGFHCQICGRTGKEAVLVVDHIEPIAGGGKTEMDNLRTLCWPCNAGKGTKLDTDT